MTDSYGGTRERAGRKTKASKGQKRYKKLSITLSPELWATIAAQRKENENTSALIARLLSESPKIEKMNIIENAIRQAIKSDFYEEV